MGSNPKVFGVEMRKVGPGHFELEGCNVQNGCAVNGWIAEVFLDCNKMHFEICETAAQAAESIENAIDDIRRDAGKLGT